MPDLTPESWVDVMLCVNDPATGLSTGRVVKADVYAGGDWLEMESPGYPDTGPVCRLEPLSRGLTQRIGRCLYPLGGYRQHVGNWCWDNAQMHRSQARRLVAHLMRIGFTVVAGPAESDLLPVEAPHAAA